MSKVNRREFVLGTAACAIAGVAAQKQGDFMKKLGVQLYTVRDSLAVDPKGTLKRVAGIGYRNVEVVRRGLPEILPILRRRSLKPVSGHFEAPLVTGSWDGWERNFPEGPGELDWNKAVEVAVDAGMKYMVISYLRPEERGRVLDYYRRFADQMNRAGEATRNAGIRLCYHNHAFEFQPMEESTPLAIFMERCEPSLVGLELDIFWSSAAGVPPEEVFKRYPGRVPLVHLKDKAPDLGQVFHEDVPDSSFKEVGYGVLDIPSIVSAAESTGSEFFFVEQDDCPGDPIDSLEKSYRYLEKLQL